MPTKRVSAKKIAETIYSCGVSVGDIYMHDKSGNKYIVLLCSVMEEDLSPVVVYAPTDIDLGWSISFVCSASEFKEKFSAES